MSHCSSTWVGFILGWLTLIGVAPVQAQKSAIEGFSQPRRIAKLSAGASGVLQHLLVQEGQHVRSGQLIAKLDSRIHEALIEIAKAGRDSTGQVAAATSDLKLKEQRMRLLDQLGQQDHASNEELFRAKSEMELSKANLQTAQERQLLRKLEFNKLLAQLKTYSVVAPFDGYLIEFKKERGEYVSSADPVICIFAELRILSVNFLVPRDRLGEIVEGLNVNVKFLHSDRQVAGIVKSVSPYPNGETNTYTVKVHVANPKGNLTAGERCRLISTTSDK